MTASVISAPSLRLLRLFFLHLLSCYLIFLIQRLVYSLKNCTKSKVMPKFKSAVTVACHVIPASGRLVDVDIPELSESPWPGLDIFWTSMGLGRRIVKELDLKLTLGMAERRITESPPDEESWGGGEQFKSWPDPKLPSLGVWLCFVSSVTAPVTNILNVKKNTK